MTVSKQGEKMKVNLSKVKLLCLGSLLTLTSLSAQAQYNGHQSSRASVVHRVDSYMNHGDVINLERAFARKLRAGQKIKSIKVVGTSNSRNAKVVLKKYGQKISAVVLSRYSSMNQLSVPSRTGLSGLKIIVKGAVHIQRIVAQVTQGHTGGNNGNQQVIKAQINKMVYGYEKLPVKKLVKQQTGVRLQGKKVKAIVFKAAKTGYRNSYATAQVLINGRPVGPMKTIRSGMTKMSVALPSYQRNIIGQDINSIKLVISGDVQVTMVGIKVKESCNPRYDYNCNY